MYSGVGKSWLTIVLEIALGYETQKVVQIRSKPIGLIYRIVQLSIFIYIALWVMWWERGYQSSDTIISGTSVRISGGALLNVDDYHNVEETRPQVWDIADVVVPPQQNSGFFITTNVLVTPNQTQSYCAEATAVAAARCRSDSDCHRGLMTNLMHGPLTGRCLKDTPGGGRCEIFGWCPVEEDLVQRVKTNVFWDVINYTALISNTVKFRQHDITRQNVLPYMNDSYLSQCHYHPTNDQMCPVFRIGDILGSSDKRDQEQMLLHGGIVAISIDWTCDFDLSPDKCQPRYSFTRLYSDHGRSNTSSSRSPENASEVDDGDHDRSAGLASGWSIHYSNQYERAGVKHRILTRAIGIQFFIHTTGKGWKFDLATFTMNCGSGLALFGGATFFCDMILLYFLKKRKFYRQAKCDILECSS